MGALPRRRWMGGFLVVAVAALVAASGHERVAAATTVRDDSGPTSVVVDRSARKLTIYEGDQPVETFDVAVGREGHATPLGDYSIRKIVWNPKWIPPDSKWAQHEHAQPSGAASNPMQVVKIYFKDPDFYIHGTNDPASIGEALSHGCIRMVPDDAYSVARYLMDHGGQPQDESWFWRVLHFRSQMKTVYLDHPIPMTVKP